MSRAKGRAASGFRSKWHSQAESLSLESLDMSRAVGRESLDMPKFGHKNLEMGRKSLCPDFRDPCPDFRDQILVCPDFRGPRRDSCPDFTDPNSRRDYAIWVKIRMWQDPQNLDMSL